MALAHAKSDANPSGYDLVEAAIDYLRDHQLTQPAMADVAAFLQVSEGHLHRQFRDWTGLTPKQFLQALTVERAKERLAESSTVLDTALDVGLSGPGRLHDHFVTLEAMTPAEYRDDGAELTIEYGTVYTPFGDAFVAFTARGICLFSFVSGAAGEDGEARLRQMFGRATLRENQAAAAERIGALWNTASGHAGSLRLLVKGTNFQVQVWRALLCIPEGSLTDYGTIAAQIGRPRATRAVASAIGANPVALFIPCHRVIRRNGDLGGYHWGRARKQLLLVKEQRPD